tara:strand:- start:20265 stop:21074 length:810 start_codon:yes stop_codon:yes gene_type:complete
MRNPSTYFLKLSILSVLFLSCKSESMDEDMNEQEQITKSVSKIIWVNEDIETDYEYDNQERLLSQQTFNNDDNTTYSISYNYTGDFISQSMETISFTNNNPSYNYKEVFTTSNSSKAISDRYYSYGNEDFEITGSREYIFDNDLIREFKIFNSDGELTLTEDFKYSDDGNILSIMITNIPQGKSTFVEFSNWDSGKKTLTHFWNDFQEIYYLFPQKLLSINNPGKMTVNTSDGNLYSEIFSYKYDEEGYVNEIDVQHSNNNKETYLIEY